MEDAVEYTPYMIDVLPDAYTMQAYRWGSSDARDPDSDVALCLHGFTGDGLDFDVFFSSAPQLPDTVAWWSLDLMGHGATSSPSDAAAYVCESAMRHLDTVIDELTGHGKRRLILVGYSMGGRLALQWAVRHPRRLHRLVLISASPGIEEEDARASRRQHDEQLCARIISQGVPAFLNFWQDQPLLRSQRSIAPRYHAQMLARRITLRARGLVGSLRGFGAGVMPSVWSTLETLEVPTLCVSGALDHKYRDVCERVASRMPVCIHRCVQGVGHSPHLEAPDEVWALMWAWLQT